MTTLRETIEVALPIEQVFDAVADFANAERWDPGVVRAERVADGSPEPTAAGAHYRLTVTFRGQSSDMTYVTTVFRRPLLVILEGEGPKILATDTIRFEPIGAGETRIHYEADLRLKGVARLAEPLLRSSFKEMGSRALAGMRSWLDASADSRRP